MTGVVGQQIKGTHPYTFRTGEWAVIRSVVPGSDRNCYLVEFEDGATDFWPVDDSVEPYEFRNMVGETNEDV
jgi:hypothetical protein